LTLKVFIIQIGAKLFRNAFKLEGARNHGRERGDIVIRFRVVYFIPSIQIFSFFVYSVIVLVGAVKIITIIRTFFCLGSPNLT